MTTRNRHQKIDDSYLTDTCFVCGSECATDQAFTYHRAISEAKQGEVLEFVICNECEEDCKSDLCEDEIFGDSDTLTSEVFDRILDWGRHTAIVSFTERENQVKNIKDVEAFFDALSQYIAWHPDNAFKDYVRSDDPYKTALAHTKDEKGCVEGCAACEDERVHTALFTPEETIALDAVMTKCIYVIDAQKNGKDVYGYAIDAMERFQGAPKDEQHKPFKLENTEPKKEIWNPAGVLALILAEKETVLLFTAREAYDKAMAYHDDETNEGELTKFLRTIGVPFIELQSRVLFEMR